MRIWICILLVFFVVGVDGDEDGELEGYFDQFFDCFWFNLYLVWGSFDL